jgi:hypothetical protein
VNDRKWAMAVAGVYFLCGLLGSGQIGLSADEFETIRAGERNLERIAAWLGGDPGPLPDWSFHEITGFYWALDTGRALFAAALGALGLAETVQAFHLAHLLLASLSLFFLHRIAQLAGAPPRAALLAAVALATLPKFVAHSLNNPKDLPALFVFVLAVHAVLLAAQRSAARNALLGGAAVGLALTSRVLSGFALGVAWLWLAAAVDRGETRAVARAQALLLASAGVAGLLFWPQLWSAPLELAPAAFDKLTTKVFTIPTLYLGSVYPADEIPWHYRPVLLAATTPPLVLGLVLASLATLGDKRVASGLRRTVVLGLAWLGVLLVADGLAWSRYDGIRHFLPALPALALLAGAGAEYALQCAERLSPTGRPALGWALRVVAVLPFVAALAANLALHPYSNAYVNAPARALASGPTDHTFEIEYWGQSYLEGARWLAQHAEADAEVVVPLFDPVARHHLALPVTEDARRFEQSDRPRYLMMITRRTYYDATMRTIESARDPVFTVERGGGRLLAIYRNDAPRR